MNRRQVLRLNLFALLVALAAAGGCAKTASISTDVDHAGLYVLESVNGQPVPATVSHDGVMLQILSGAFTINADGTCGSRMVFVPPGGTEMTREVDATYTKVGSLLTMKWEGAGITAGTVGDGTFSMDNEGMTFVYRK